MNSYFKTTNFYLASFLMAKGCKLTKVDRAADRNKAVFVFAENDLAEKLTKAYTFSSENSTDASVDARKIIQAIKTLKDEIYQDK